MPDQQTTGTLMSLRNPLSPAQATIHASVGGDGEPAYSGGAVITNAHFPIRLSIAKTHNPEYRANDVQQKAGEQQANGGGNV